MTSHNKIIFRCDGNPKIGAGHIMRCLSAADAADDPRNILFVTADDHFRNIITSRGYQNITLHTDYSFMEAELSRFLPVIKEIRPAYVFADSYYVSGAYLTALQNEIHKYSGMLVYLDDVLAFPYPADVLINYNIYGPDKEQDYIRLYNRAKMPAPEFLLGPSYAPLRKEFRGLPKREVRETAADILISTGGADPDHIALGLCRYIAEQAGLSHRFTFHFVIGAMNGDKEELKQLAASDAGIRLHFNVSDMCGLMSRADLAVSAAGSTLYELCAAQTPAVTYVLADNQIPGAEGFVKHGILSSVGDIRKDTAYAPKLLQSVVSLADDYNRRRETAVRQRMLVDGRGAWRIMHRLKISNSSALG